LRSRAGLPPRGLPDGGLAAIGAFSPLTALLFSSVFERAACFDGFAALTLRDTVARFAFGAAAFALRAGACAFPAEAFVAVFFTTFFAGLLADLAALLAGFFAAIGEPLYKIPGCIRLRASQSIYRARHASRPLIIASFGKLRPMKTTLLKGFSFAAQGRPTSAPISM
jgi:hypothetical protein